MYLGNIFFETEAYDTGISLVQNTETNIKKCACSIPIMEQNILQLPRVYNEVTWVCVHAWAFTAVPVHLSKAGDAAWMQEACGNILWLSIRWPDFSHLLFERQLFYMCICGSDLQHLQLYLSKVFLVGFTCACRSALQQSVKGWIHCQQKKSIPANENHVLTHKQYTCHIAIAVHGGWGYCHAEREQSIRNWKRVKTQHPFIIFIYIYIYIYYYEYVYIAYTIIYILYILHICAQRPNTENSFNQSPRILLWAVSRARYSRCMFFEGCVVSNALRISEKHNWLVVSTPLKNITFITFIGLQQGSIDNPAAHLKNISQWEGLSHILWKIKLMFETTNQTIMCSCDLNWTQCRTSLCSRVFPTGWLFFLSRLFDAMEIGHFHWKPGIKTLDSFENKQRKKVIFIPQPPDIELVEIELTRFDDWTHWFKTMISTMYICIYYVHMYIYIYRYTIERLNICEYIFLVLNFLQNQQHLRICPSGDYTMVNPWWVRDPWKMNWCNGDSSKKKG